VRQGRLDRPHSKWRRACVGSAIELFPAGWTARTAGLAGLALRKKHHGSGCRRTGPAPASLRFSQWRRNFFATKLFISGDFTFWGLGLRAGLKKRAVLRRWPLSRRVIALAAAYAIALSGLITSFGAATVTAAALTQPGGVLCHGNSTDQPATSRDGTTGKVCVDDCCIGCLAMPGALPVPPAVVARPQSSTDRVATLPSFTLVRTADSHYHGSRAPPAAA
jgi:hypothetical protein